MHAAHWPTGPFYYNAGEPPATTHRAARAAQAAGGCRLVQRSVVARAENRRGCAGAVSLGGGERGAWRWRLWVCEMRCDVSGGGLGDAMRCEWRLSAASLGLGDGWGRCLDGLGIRVCRFRAGLRRNRREGGGA